MNLMALRTGARKPSEYAKPLHERAFKRVVNLDLEDPAFDAVFAYAVEVAPDRSVQDSLRDLLLQAIAENARDATIRSAHKQAYLDARARGNVVIAATLRAMAAELELDRGPSPATDGAQLENRVTVDESQAA